MASSCAERTAAAIGVSFLSLRVLFLCPLLTRKICFASSADRQFKALFAPPHRPRPPQRLALGFLEQCGEEHGPVQRHAWRPVGTHRFIHTTGWSVHEMSSVAGLGRVAMHAKHVRAGKAALS